MPPNLALMHHRLPDCPAPKCRACRHHLFDVRPYRASQPNTRLVLVHCLSRCERCSTPHIGVRAMAPVGVRLRFIHQAFERYTDERKAELEQVAAYLNRGEQPIELHPQVPYPAQPRFAIWFENTRSDPERAAPHAPAAGLPTDVLRAEAGVTILERRPAPTEGFLSGVLVEFSGAERAVAWLEALRATARLCGSVAWCRRYDQPEAAVAWDTHTPAPGNEEQRPPAFVVGDQEGCNERPHA